MPEGKRVLFVCLGNICRSPAGEGVLQRRVEERGLAALIEIDSAGTAGYHTGELPDRRMRAAAARRGYDLKSRARQVHRDDLDRFDLILAMDRSNLRDVQSLSQRQHDHVRLLSDFLPEGWPVDVPDPYEGGPEGFETVLDMLEAASPAILDHLLHAPRRDGA